MLILVHLIDFITNLAFYGRLSLEKASPADNHLGLLVIVVPIIGGIIIGLMARYGSQAIRGHGIPEAMEQVLTNRSRIPARMTVLKPVSAAIAMGTGGPFGAEGPIIATGGALGSLVGQFIRMTPSERKTLLAVGAAAGMAAIFGSPVAAVLLSIELLLFEYRAAIHDPGGIGCRYCGLYADIFTGSADPVFPMPAVAAPHFMAMAFYIFLGGIMGVAAAAVTRILYAVEDAFEHLPIHWMWWPAIGARGRGDRLFRAAYLGRRLCQYYPKSSRITGPTHFVGLVVCLPNLFLGPSPGQRHFRRNDGAVVHRRRRIGTSVGRRHLALSSSGNRPKNRRASRNGGHVCRCIASIFGINSTCL